MRKTIIRIHNRNILHLNGFRVYIAKNTFTTLIDHFTSYAPSGCIVKLIKFELLTQSIRQQKLPTARGYLLRFSAFDPAVRMALADMHRRSYILLRKTLSD